MKSSCRKRWIGLVLVFFVFLASLSPPFRSFATFPESLRIFAGEDRQLSLSMPVSARVYVRDAGILRVNGSVQPAARVNLMDPIRLRPEQTGQTEMKVKLFGTIPFKTVKVSVIPDLKLLPGGQTIGVKLKSAGILVVGHHQVNVASGKKLSPGETANIQSGDLILSMNGNAIRDVSRVSELVEKAGEKRQAIEIELLRGGEKRKVSLTPAYDIIDKSYRLGLYIRDSAAGVGTLTFYSPERGVYGALGHVISDMDTQTPIVVGGGEIVHSNVTSIAKSQSGEPGEKHAQFFRESKVIGNIVRNTNFGIFGKMYGAPDHGITKDAIPVAFAEDVQEGPAQIYTVVSGQKVERFDIVITHVARQDIPATKGLVIKITDARLLEKTGGIVQGMSGSPIIQKGKMVGAVTHVLVNDPTSGYGCHIEWMLRDAGILAKQTQQEPKAA